MYDWTKTWCRQTAFGGVLFLAATAWAGDPGTAEHIQDEPARADMEMEGDVMEAAPFAEYVAPGDSLPRLRFLADGLVTLNDRCPVRKVKLNQRMRASYVNGHPVGFC